MGVHEPSVSFDIQLVPGFRNILFGGEGLFLASLTGPGEIHLQSMPILNLAEEIARYLPNGDHGGGGMGNVATGLAGAGVVGGILGQHPGIGQLTPELALPGRVVAVSRNPRHALGKTPALSVRLIAGLGVEGDAHAGRDGAAPLALGEDAGGAEPAPGPPDPGRTLRRACGPRFRRSLRVRSGRTSPRAAWTCSPCPRARVCGWAAKRRWCLPGLRNPCVQLERLHKGLMAATLARAPDGSLVRKAGVMAVVETGGEVFPGDPVEVELPRGPHRRLVPI